MAGAEAAEAVAGATGAEEAAEGLEAEAWAGAAEAGAEAPWETTQRTKTTSMRTRWIMEKVRNQWETRIMMTIPRS